VSSSGISFNSGTKMTRYSYSHQMSASGASSFTWTASGLPDGLVISSSGLISGKLSCNSLYNLQNFSSSVSFTAKSGSATATKTLTLNCVITINNKYEKIMLGYNCS
jgi:mevalonate pyrophosphate decarboxylase